MAKRWSRTPVWGLAAAGLLTTAALGQTGCQVSIGGQTLPSPYYQQDDVQYFAAGPEFKLSNEAAALDAYNANQQLERARRGPRPPQQ